MISMIAAVAENGVIGKESSLPWHYPEDLKFFRAMTKGKAIIMGRKTFDSLNGVPLPHRYNIIVTRVKDYMAPPGCAVAHTVDQALALAKAWNLEKAVGEEAAPAEQEIMIIGGSEMYALFMSVATRLYLTQLKKSFEGDAFFPAVDWSEWRLVEEKTYPEFVIKTWDREKESTGSMG